MSLHPTLDPARVFQDRLLFDALSRLLLRWMRSFDVPEREREDVKQNVLFALHRRLLAFDPDRPFWPWLKTIAYRSARDHLRLVRHQRERLEGGADERSDAEDLDAEERLLLAEAKQEVWEVLNSFDAPRRELLVRHDHDGVPMAQIAAAQGIPVNTAYTRLGRARADFRLSWRRKTAASWARIPRVRRSGSSSLSPSQSPERRA